MEEKKAQWVPWPEFQEMSKPKRFFSFAEATAWAMEQVAFNNEADMIVNEQLKPELPDGVLTRMPKGVATEKDKEEFNQMTKEVKYQRWLIEVGELQEQLETQLDNAQDLWIEGENFKSWLVKHEGAWFDVERSMQQVYSHIDSALHFLKIIRGEKKDD